MYIGVVIPLFKSEKTIGDLIASLIDYFNTKLFEFNIVLVDDGCPSNSYEAVKHLLIGYNNISYVKLSRNFGQHQAIAAGLQRVKGDWVVVMDADLQDLPTNIDLFLNAAVNGGYDVVVGLRKKRRDNLLRKIESLIFYKTLNLLTGLELNEGLGNFGIYKRKVINSFNHLGEGYRSFGMFILWLGFKRLELPIEHGFRKEGKSSYTFKKKISLAIDTFLSFSDRPLKLIISMGMVIFTAAMFFLILEIVRISIFSKPLEGWISLILMTVFGVGLILISLGVVGLYVGKTFIESKKRPLYVIDEIINNDPF